MESREPKRGINPGSSLDAVDISLSSETDDKNNSGEDSDSSEEGMQVIRDDLLRQGQVSPPSSPKENRFLAGLMKSPPKLQLDEQSKPAQDKESPSLLFPQSRLRQTWRMQIKGTRQVMLQDMTAACLHRRDFLPLFP